MVFLNYEIKNKININELKRVININELNIKDIQINKNNIVLEVV